MPPVVTGYVDFQQMGELDELAAELEASMPELPACGLDVRALQHMRMVMGQSGRVEGQLIGLPTHQQLLGCPMVPQLVAAAEAKGWTLEDAEGSSLRLRRADSSPLDAEVFDFTSPEGQWLFLHADAGPAERRISVTITSDPHDEIALLIGGPSATIDAAAGWCKRVIDSQRSLELSWLAACRRPDAKTLAIVPAQVDIDAAIEAMATVRSSFFETFTIHGDSMLPNLRDGDVAFVDKTRGGIPPRGTIVMLTTDQETYVKRVVGLPGERLELGVDGILIDGTPLSATAVERSGAAARCGLALREQRFDDGTRFEFFDARVASPQTVDVPDGHVFVLGDNRAISKDSRVLGPIPVERIVGRAKFIAWSVVGDTMDWERTTSPIR